MLCVFACLALSAVACSGGGGPTSAAAPATTAVADTSTAPRPTSSTTSSSLKAATTTTGVSRTTVTSPLTLGPGNASLVGTVSGPQGPVDGATVRVERLVGKAVATADVTTFGGAWQLPAVLGGSYRVRAFKAPDLAQSPVEVFFLAADERRVVDFKLTAAGGDRITAVINPNPPKVDQSATLTISVGTGRVDDQGRPALTPRPGVTLILAPGAGYALESVPQAVTDGNGSATWRLHCVVEGTTSMSLTVGSGVTSVNLPPCGAAAPAAPAAPTTTKTP